MPSGVRAGSVPFSIRRMMVAGRTFNRMAVSATEIQVGEDAESIVNVLFTINAVVEILRNQL